MPEADHGQLDRLLTRLVEKTITAEEFAALETLLNGDAGAQERYMHYLGLHADLQDVVEKPELQVEQGGEESSRGYRRSRTMVWLTGTAAALLLLGLSVIHFLRPSEGGATPILRVAEWNGAVGWTGDGGRSVRGIKIGDELTGGTLEVVAADSWAELVFDDGTRVWASGPAIATFSGGPEGKRIHLRKGELSLEPIHRT